MLHRFCRTQRNILMATMIYTSPHSIAHTMQSRRVGYFDCLLSKEKGDLNNPAVLAKVSVWACIPLSISNIVSILLSIASLVLRFLSILIFCGFTSCEDNSTLL